MGVKVGNKIVYDLPSPRGSVTSPDIEQPTPNIKQPIKIKYSTVNKPDEGKLSTENKTTMKVGIFIMTMLIVIFIVTAVVSFINIKDEEGKLNTSNLTIGILSVVGTMLTSGFMFYFIYNI
jgi:hypothetical protein